jgi:hypothetical protein
MPAPEDRSEKRWLWAGRAVVLAAAVVALASARPFAGGWYDGSRLALIEVLGERGTFAIDDSFFVKPPPVEAGRPMPYASEPLLLNLLGTQDKLLIDGRFYSDKPPVLGVLMAQLYRVWLAAGGPTAAERPDLFCRLFTVLTSGVGFVVAVWCVWRLALVLGLRAHWAAVLTFAFAFATVGPVYTQFANNHAAGLGPAAALCVALASAGERPRWTWLVLIGTLGGFTYTFDLGLGPALMVALFAYVAVVYRARGVLLAGLGALPWLLAHHWYNYAVGGTFLPANSVPEYLAWPNSPFDAKSMTGGFKHKPLRLIGYSADMLFGRKGFFLHNLPLLLAPGGAVIVWLANRAARPAVAFAAGWAALSWLVYATQSSNMSGMCVSVRWFVPLLAPGFWIIGMVLRDAPRYRLDFLWLTAFGAVIAFLNCTLGPWTTRMTPGFWLWVALALIGWGVIRWRDYRTPRGFATAVPLTPRSSSAA